MAQAVLVLEGTWEEILARASELAGRRLRITVLPSQPTTEQEKPPLNPANQEMLALLDTWEKTPLTIEDIAVLDGMEQFLQEQPFSLRRIEEKT